MPWKAIHEGKEKPPHQVPKKVDVECATCGGRMRIWTKSSDGKARHFKHIGAMGSGDSGGGAACDSIAESDEHMIWKGFSADALLAAFGDKVEDWEGYNQEDKRNLLEEKGLDAPASDKQWRVGDVVLTFDEPDEQLGDGIIVEVQHKNESKDIDMTTTDYIQQGYSVVWLYEDDFGSDRCRLSEVDFRHRALQNAWPEHVPHQSDWWEPTHNYKTKQKRWETAFEQGLCTSGAPATLPREWCDREALRIWREQKWEHLFRDFRKPIFEAGSEKHTFSLEQYDSGDYIEEVKESLATAPIPARLPREWYDREALRIWREQDWTSLFQEYEPNRVEAGGTPQVHCTVNLAKWLADNELILHRQPLSGANIEYTPTEVGDFAPEPPAEDYLIPESMLDVLFQDQNLARLSSAEPERPPNPFNDVQCWCCGAYWHVSKGYEVCRNCDTDVDIEWNIDTGRIDHEAVR